MRRGDDHGHAGFADQQAAQAMDDGDALNLVRGGNFAADFGHQLERHGLVAFVIQAAGGAPLGVVADRAFEGHHRAFGAGYAGRAVDGARVDGTAGQGEVVAGRSDDFAGSASRSRR